jgi:hypothetical protein
VVGVAVGLGFGWLPAGVCGFAVGVIVSVLASPAGVVAGVVVGMVVGIVGTTGVPPADPVGLTAEVPLSVGAVMLPFGNVAVTVGTAVLWPALSEPLAEVGAELSAETFRTLVGLSLATVEPSWDVITQTTGPMASSTDSALTIGPIRPRRRALLRCRPGVGESLIGWRILFVDVPRDSDWRH